MGYHAEWARMVTALRTAGLSLPTIAKKIGCGKAMPYRWLNGSEPRGLKAVALLNLYKLHCEGKNDE